MAMDQKEILVARLFEVVKKSWENHEQARRANDIDKMRLAFDETSKLLRILHVSGYQTEVEEFLRKNEMPVRAILARIARNGE